VLGVDEGRDAALALGVCHCVKGHGGLTGGFRPVNFYDAATGKAANSQSYVQRNGTGRDNLDRGPDFVPEPHDRAFTELLVDLGKRCFERFCTIRGCRHGSHL
jgi:hypothetical protein